MNNMIQNIKILVRVIQYSISCWFQTIKGQLPQYEILQLSHRLEKGLLNNNPKPLWGWEKAVRLCYLLGKTNDVFSKTTGNGVIAAYLKSKLISDSIDEQERVRQFIKEYGCDLNNMMGGVKCIDKESVLVNDKSTIVSFFKSRHSTRDFSNEIVSKKDIEAAIDLALSCPSACNRQPTKCYIYQTAEVQSVILTVNIRAYNSMEFNDWVVSPSIFAGYLTLCFHLYGIGSCVYRKQLYGKSSFNIKMRNHCNIPDEEMVILELQFGYYKDKFNVAFSNRKSAEEIISYIKE